jgi:hypothetical protein
MEDNRMSLMMDANILEDSRMSHVMDAYIVEDSLLSHMMDANILEIQFSCVLINLGGSKSLDDSIYNKIKPIDL